MSRRAPHYLSYLLRLWQTGSTGHATWRASLEDPHSGERLGFASLEDLVAFLQQQTRAPNGRPVQAERRPGGED